MFDFLFDNPQIIIFLLIFILYKVFGGRKKNGAPGVAEAGRKRARTTEERLREALEEANRRRAAASSEPARPLPASRVADSPVAANRSDDPFAFHSLMQSGPMEKGARAAVDYDTSATDYDADSSKFAFRSASAEPESQEYHLGGFKQFRSAGGMSGDPVTPVAGQDAVRPGQATILSALLANPEEIKRAVIMQEILGKPKSFRR
ncbi:MAG: hypothetical protein JWQ98_1704 [Chlorobi bacterium]|nr:hypothetical protein [Chlorobiota bacterium]